MNVQILVNSVVQQTMVLLAHIATAGGSRAPLAQVANQIFLDLTNELMNQGVKKNVIADMFGLALRTYHRKIRTIAECRTDGGQSIWEAVLNYIRQKEPVSAGEIQQRFQHDDPAVVSSVLNDLSNTGMVYRAGRGIQALYRIADQEDFQDRDDSSREDVYQYLVWLTVYRQGPIALKDLSTAVRLDEAHCKQALDKLVSDGRVNESQPDETTLYHSPRFDVPVGTAVGWEVALLDHYQAVVSAICVKLRSGMSRSEYDDTVGGGTYTLELWPGHPFEKEALGMLATVRRTINELRDRIDNYNSTACKPDTIDQVVFYMGQYVKIDRNDE